MTARPRPDPEAADRRLAALLAACVVLDASDLHLAPGQPPHARVAGDLAPRPDLAGGPDDAAAVGDALLRAVGAAGLPASGAFDGALTAVDGTRFRFNVYRRMGGVSVALRRLEDRFRRLDELGLPTSLYDLCSLPDGIVLVAGPTGAGKSTTLAALLDHVNRTRRAHVVTIEEPIEYVHAPQRSLVDQRQVGVDAASFDGALVASLRQDPDVILVGEVRDLETIRTAIRAAETGHLVLTTVHAGDVAGTVERLVSVFPADEQAGLRQQLALVLRAVVAQRLLPADGRAAPAAGRRRVVASEILVTTPAAANLIATGKTAQLYAVLEAGGARGMQTLEQDLARLLVEGMLTEASALAASRFPDLVRDRAALLARRRAGAPGGGR